MKYAVIAGCFFWIVANISSAIAVSATHYWPLAALNIFAAILSGAVAVMEWRQS